MKIADDFAAIARRVRELKQEDAKAEQTTAREATMKAGEIFKWAKMVEAAKIRVVSQPRNPFVAP